MKLLDNNTWIKGVEEAAIINSKFIILFGRKIEIGLF